MVGDGCSNPRIELEHDSDQQVHSVMVRAPKTLPVTATVGEVRTLFANSHVRLALLADGERFAGAIARGDLHAHADDGSPAQAYIQARLPTIGPDAPISEAMAILERTDLRRLVVSDPDNGRLLGLLCLTPDGTGFCQS